jgi:hypothetical protein
MRLRCTAAPSLPTATTEARPELPPQRAAMTSSLSAAAMPRSRRDLCHGCQACFYACQYAPPHPFSINVPKIFAEVRHESNAAHAWPAPFAVLFRRNGLGIAMAIGVAGVLPFSFLLQPDAVLSAAQPVLPGATGAARQGLL